VFSRDYKWLALAAVQRQGFSRVGAVPGAGHRGRADKGQKPLTMAGAGGGTAAPGLLAANVRLLLNNAVARSAMRRRRRERGRGAWGVFRPARRDLGSAVRHNAAMRKNQYQRQPIGHRLDGGRQGEHGDGIRGVHGRGAALDLMEDSWWARPSDSGPPYFCRRAHTARRVECINSAGQRFVNEAAPLQRRRPCHVRQEPGSAPTSRVADRGSETTATATCSVTCCDLPRCRMPGTRPVRCSSRGAWRGWLPRSEFPPQALRTTVNRFNGIRVVRAGHRLPPWRQRIRPLLHRSGLVPTSCLGGVVGGAVLRIQDRARRPRHQAGMRTDPRARCSGRRLGDSRLYSAGNASAAVMGHSYAGAGSTIGQPYVRLCSANDIYGAQSDVDVRLGTIGATIQSVSIREVPRRIEVPETAAHIARRAEFGLDL